MSSLLDNILKDDKNTQFLYIVITIIIFFIVSKLVDVQLYHFMGLILVVLFVYNYQNRKDLTSSTDMELLDYKLAALQLKMYDYITNYIHKLNPSISNVDLQNVKSRSVLDYMYLDANMINLMYSLIDLYQYNPDSFQKMLKCVNNLLHIRNDLQYLGPIDRPADHFEIAESLAQKATNYLHTFQLSVPKNTVTVKLLSDALKRFQILIKRNLDIIVKICNKDAKDNLNSSTTFINYYNGVKPYYDDINISLTPEHNKERSKQQNPLFEWYY